MIDKRPKIVEERSRIGDWKIDTVVGKDHKGFLVTVVDRKSKFTIIKATQTKHADVVTKALIEMLTPMKGITHTITNDNAKEFAYHRQVSDALSTNFYFVHHNHSWERGLNQHTNGLIQQYLSKKNTFLNVSKDEVFMSEFSRKMAA